MKYAQDLLDENETSYAKGGFNARLLNDTYHETLDGHRGYAYKETAYGWNAADEMIKNGEIFSEIIGIEFKCSKDGNMWCCVAPEFVDLIESDCYSFGATRAEAISRFLNR